MWLLDSMEWYLKGMEDSRMPKQSWKFKPGGARDDRTHWGEVETDQRCNRGGEWDMTQEEVLSTLDPQHEILLVWKHYSNRDATKNKLRKILSIAHDYFTVLTYDRCYWILVK